MTNNCSENDEEENNSDHVITTRFAMSKKKQQLKVSKMSDRQSKIVLSFQMT